MSRRFRTCICAPLGSLGAHPSVGLRKGCPLACKCLFGGSQKSLGPEVAVWAPLSLWPILSDVASALSNQRRFSKDSPDYLSLRSRRPLSSSASSARVPIILMALVSAKLPCPRATPSSISNTVFASAPTRSRCFTNCSAF